MLSVKSPPADFIELSVAEQSIPALYRRDRSGRDYGAVLLLHDKNGAMDSQGPVSAIRRLLPEHGWSVISVALAHIDRQSLPTESASAVETDSGTTPEQPDSPEATEDDETAGPVETPAQESPVADIQRIQAAVSHLQADAPRRLIVVGVGAGALEAIKSVASLPMPASGLVLINTPTLDRLGENIFTSIALRVLDMTAGQAPQPLQTAARKREAMMSRVQHGGYSQRIVAGADAAFYAQREQVARMTRNWLYQQFIAPERTP